MSRMINFRADDELDARLTRLAQLTGRTKTFYVRQAIERQMDDLEDIFLADQITHRVQSGLEKLHTLDEVERGLGLADWIRRQRAEKSAQDGPSGRQTDRRLFAGPGCRRR